VSRHRVLVLRALEDAQSLVQCLGDLELDPVILPLLAMEPVGSPEALRARINEHAPDWILVTSRRAARLLGDAAPFREGVCFGSVGPGTTRMLRSTGLEVHLEGDGSGAADLARVFGERAGPPEAGRPLAIVWPTGDRSLDVLPKSVSALGHELVPLIAYRTRLIEPNAEAWQQAVTGAAAGCFTSPSTVQAFMEAARTHQSLTCLDHLLAASFGGSTEGALREAGFKKLVKATKSSPEALAQAVADSL